MYNRHNPGAVRGVKETSRGSARTAYSAGIHSEPEGSSQNMTNSEEDARGFFVLKGKISKDTGLDLSQYKDSYLKRRIAVRMRTCAKNTYTEYAQHLVSNSREYDRLMKDITVNVTEFFRDTSVFNLVEEEILPLMIYEKFRKNINVLRIWSAGCSSGEEPYSLAIIVKELLGDHLSNYVVQIHASDIDDGSLAAAKDGKYLPRQVEHVKPEYLRRYFRFDGKHYILSEEIRNMVRIRKLDLFSEKMGVTFDMIFCRNVVIYFSKEQQDKLFMKFYDALKKGGYFIMGKTETLFGDARERFASYNGKERIYRKMND